MNEICLMNIQSAEYCKEFLETLRQLSNNKEKEHKFYNWLVTLRCFAALFYPHQYCGDNIEPRAIGVGLGDIINGEAIFILEKIL